MKQLRAIWPVSIFLVLSNQLVAVDAAAYAKLCPLSESPLVKLQYDSSTKQFSLLDDTKGQAGGDRSLRETIVQFGKHLSSQTFRGAKRYRLQETTKSTFHARHCPCDSTGNVYCLVDTDTSSTPPDTCGIPQGTRFTVSSPYNYGTFFNTTKQENSTIDCFELQSQTVFIRNAWPVVVLWYAALIVFFLATANGKYAQMYFLNACCPMLGINERYVDRVLRRENELRARLRDAAVRAENVANGPGRYLRRSRGVRVRGSNLLNDQQRTEHPERDAAFRRWLEAVEAFGIFNATEVSDDYQMPMEYVLRTRRFHAKKENEKKKNRNLQSPVENEIASRSVSTPVKKHNNLVDGEGGPSTPETVESNDSLGNNSPEFNESDDTSELDVESSQTVIVDEETGLATHQKRDDADDEHDHETLDCTICLMEVCDGEQVGVLPCSHIFHVDCLREWIIRRNACPLCQTEIATPRPVQIDTASNHQESFSSGESGASRGDGPNIETGGYRRMPSLPEITSETQERLTRTMSGTMTSPSQRNRREYNRHRTRRQRRDDPFSFAVR
ncbi:hypothetical protein ACHAW6_015123 [Cyclotella cf. meneghiniana]